MESGGERARAEARRRLLRLSEQEWRAFRFLCQGLSYAQIAIQLRVTKRAVQEYLARAYIKLGLDGIDNFGPRMQVILEIYKPLVDEIGEWPGKKPPPPPPPTESTSIVPIPPKVLDMVKVDEPKSTGNGDSGEGEGDVIDGDVTFIEPPFLLPPPQPQRGRWLTTGSLLTLIVVAAAVWLTNRLGWWSPASPASVTEVEVTRQVPVTQTLILQVSTTPLPTAPPALPTIMVVPVTVLVTPEPNGNGAVASSLSASDTDTPVPPPTTKPTAAATPTPMPETGVIGFANPSQPDTLADSWHWSPGGSAESKYRLSADGSSVTIISGPRVEFYGNTDTAPYLTHSLPDRARVTVRLEFDPRERFHVAGLVFRSQTKPNTWVALRRYSDGGGGQYVDMVQVQDGNAQNVVTINYAQTTIYFRISRDVDEYTFEISENGHNWLTLRTGYLFLMPGPMEALLYVLSTSGNGIVGQFSEFTLSAPVALQIPELTGPVAFAAPDSPDTLAAIWGYNPGGSLSNDIRIVDGKLILVAGPRTESYDGGRTAPFVYIPMTGVFTAQVKLEFDPHERFHVAGFGLRSKEEPADVISLRRWSDGGNQLVDVGKFRNGFADLGQHTYPGRVIYLRLHRDEPQVTLAFSPDGRSWTDIQTNYIMGFGEPVTLYLYVWSSSANGISATFSDLQITR